MKQSEKTRKSWPSLSLSTCSPFLKPSCLALLIANLSIHPLIGTKHDFSILRRRGGDSRINMLVVRPIGSSGKSDTEGDAEDRDVGLLRCESHSGAACEVGRYDRDRDADHQQPEAAGRCGLAGAPGGAIAARHLRSGERKRAGRTH